MDMEKRVREALPPEAGESGSWAEDPLAVLRGSRRFAWIVATAAATIGVCEAVALIVVAPLKTVVPYTLMVDRHTGYVQALRPLGTDTLAPDAALTQSFLVQYVVARESYDVNDVQNTYRKVNLWSGQSPRAEYVAAMQASNPASPLVRYPRTTVIATRVESISPLGGQSVLVRFQTQRRDAGGQLGLAQPWVAVMRYRFVSAAQSSEDRLVNPLGFQVDHYRRSAEALIAPDPVTAPALPTITAPGGAMSGPARTGLRSPGYLPPGYVPPGYVPPSGYVAPRTEPSRPIAPRSTAPSGIEVTL